MNTINFNHNNSTSVKPGGLDIGTCAGNNKHNNKKQGAVQATFECGKVKQGGVSVEFDSDFGKQTGKDAEVGHDKSSIGTQGGFGYDDDSDKKTGKDAKMVCTSSFSIFCHVSTNNQKLIFVCNS
jgi:hypothetical protein